MRKTIYLYFDSLQTASFFSFDFACPMIVFVIVLSNMLSVKLTILSFWLRNMLLKYNSILHHK